MQAATRAALSEDAIGEDTGAEDQEPPPLTEDERLALAAFDCAERGDTEELRRLAERGVDLGMVDEGGCSLAHEAAAEGQADVLHLLGKTTGETLQRVRSTLAAHEAELGWTPLHAAASQGHAECINLLTQIAYNTGVASTTNAAAFEDVFAARDRDGGIPLHVAAMSGHVEAVNALLATIEPANGPVWTPIGARDNSNLTALHNAIIEGHAGAVRALVGWGCHNGDVEDVCRNLLGASVTTHFGNAFHFAATAGQPTVIVTIQDEVWLHFGERSTRPMLELLSALDADNMTPLHRAVSRGHASCCAPLDFSVTGKGIIPLSEAWGICALDGQLRTSAHLVAAGGHVDCLHELLRIGLPVRWLLRADANRGLPTQYAAHHGHLSVLLELAKATQRPTHHEPSVIDTGSPSLKACSSKRTHDSRLPIWRRARPRLGGSIANGLQAAERGGSLLYELACDSSIAVHARNVAANAARCFLTAAYQRLAFAAIFMPQSHFHLRGGTAAIIDASARLPRTGNRSWLKPDGITCFEDVELTPGWVEILGPTLRTVVGAGYATVEVATRFWQQGGWAWCDDAHKRSRRRRRSDASSSGRGGSRRKKGSHKKSSWRGSKVIVEILDE